MQWPAFRVPETVKNPVIVVLAMHVTLFLPAWFTLDSVKVTRPMVDLGLHPDPSPFGYTISLSLWLFPALAVLALLSRHPQRKLPLQSFAWTVGILFVLGVILDFFLGNLFFAFPCRGATLGFDLWGIDWSTMSLARNIPVEEFFFYFFGDSAALLIYLFCDIYWLDRYSQASNPYPIAERGRLLQFAWWPIVLGVAMVLAAALYKRFLSPFPDGFPWYFTFLVFVAFVPAALFFTKVRERVNWRAYVSTALTMFFISLLYECTIAYPYGWWAYKDSMILGVRVRAMSGLPVEEPFLWLLVSFNAVILFETIRAIVGSEESIRHVLFGREISQPEV